MNIYTCSTKCTKCSKIKNTCSINIYKFIHVAQNVAKSKIRVVLTFIHVAQNSTKSEKQRKNRNTF